MASGGTELGRAMGSCCLLRLAEASTMVGWGRVHVQAVLVRVTEQATVAGRGGSLGFGGNGSIGFSDLRHSTHVKLSAP